MGEYQLAGPEWLTLVRSVRSVSRSTFLVITTGGWTYTWNRINSPARSRWSLVVSDDGAENTAEVMIQNQKAAVAAVYGPWLPRFSPPLVEGFVTDWAGGVPAAVLQQLWGELVKRLRTLGVPPKYDDAWIWAAKPRVVGWNGWRPIKLTAVTLQGKPLRIRDNVALWDDVDGPIPLMMSGYVLDAAVPGEGSWSPAPTVGVTLPNGEVAAAVKVLQGTTVVTDSGTIKVSVTRDDPGPKVLTVTL